MQASLPFQPIEYARMAGRSRCGPQLFRNHAASILLNLNADSDFAVNLLPDPAV
jgi:hypothetical protein